MTLGIKEKIFLLGLPIVDEGHITSRELLSIRPDIDKLIDEGYVRLKPAGYGTISFPILTEQGKALVKYIMEDIKGRLKDD